MTDSTPLLEIRNLQTVFPSNGQLVEAVTDVNLNLSEGEILGVVGESGCGKSTLLLSIMRLLRYPGRITSGNVYFRGVDVTAIPERAMRDLRGKEMAMIFQDPLSTLNPAFPVGEQIRESLRLHHIIAGGGFPFFDRVRTQKERERVLQIMDEVGIPAPMDHYASYPHQFSGGMQQRALIAISLVCGPALLLADEPTTALDVTIQAQIMDLMKKINQERGTAIILVTHDLGLAAEFCDRIAVMYAGRVVEQGTVDQVIEMSRHPYTQGLLACRPVLGDRANPIRPIPGNVPRLTDLPPGCAFAPRCQFRQEACERGAIPIFQTRDHHQSRCIQAANFVRQPGWDWKTVCAEEACQ